MFCTNCGQALNPDALYCGNCGQKVQDEPSKIYQVFKYDISYAKGNKAFVSMSSLMLHGLAYCLTPLILIFINTDLILITMVLCMCGVAALVAECLFKRKYYLARQSAIVRNRLTNTWYYITMFGDTLVGFDTLTRILSAAHNVENSAQQARLAQADHLMVQEVESYLNGENKYNIWTGGDVRVLVMRDFHIREKKAKYYICDYYDKNGKEKSMRLPDCFAGLKEILK